MKREDKSSKCAAAFWTVRRRSSPPKASRCLISQVALYPAFGLCYMMTITYQTIGASRFGLFLSLIRQGLFYVPFILLLPRLFGVFGIYASQPAADLLTILVCLCSIKPMKRLASRRMRPDACVG